MKLNVQTDGLTEWNQAVLRYVEDSGREPFKALSSQAGLLMEQIVRFTPPIKGQRQGLNAVKRDINRTAWPINPDDFTDERLRRRVRRAAEQHDLVTLQKFADERLGPPRFSRSKVIPWSAQHHKEQRDRRGRVTSNRHFATTDGGEMKEYIGRKQQGVGSAKGGWVGGLIALGRPVKAWYGRHMVQGFGKNGLLKGGDGEFIAENRSRWASLGDEDRIVANAMKQRAPIMHKAVEMALERAAKKARLN